MACEQLPIIAVPDAEYAEIARRIQQLEHRKSLTLLSSSKEPIRFYRTDAGIRAVRTIDGKKVRSQVEPLSVVMPKQTPAQERQQLKEILRRDNPTYNDARLELEVDLIHEKRASVEKIMKEMKCSPQQAYQALEQGIALMEAQKRMESQGDTPSDSHSQ
jgi:hypothetical protein